jgi:hypothetical protein
VTLSFRAPIAIRGINPYVLVSAARAARLQPDWRGPMPVAVRINGQPESPHRINLMPAGEGSYFLYLDATVRKASATKVGDTVRIVLEFDADYRGGPAGPMPRWFSSAPQPQSGGQEGLERTPAQSSERNPALLRAAEIRRGPRSQSRKSVARSLRRQSPLHGTRLERRALKALSHGLHHHSGDFLHRLRAADHPYCGRL